MGEAAEAYVQQVQMDQAQSGRSTYSNERKRSHKVDICRRAMEA